MQARQLLILRHAKSDWGTDAPNDFERPLAERGRKDAPRMGKWLKDQGLAPDHVVSSPAKRARQTAIKFCHELGVEEDRIEWEPRIYEAGMDALLEILAECPDTKHTVLMVGHNPGMADLLLYLGGADVPDPPDGKVLPTATLARLEMPADWTRLEPGGAKLISLVRPRSLR